MICLITTTLIQNFAYMHFGIILTQFYINFSRQENQIELCNRSQSTPEIFRFKPIPPFKCIFVCVYDWWDEYRTETQDIFNSWLMYLYIYLVTGGKETGLKPRIAYPVPGLYIYIYVLVTEFRKKSDARVYRVQKKRNSWLRKILRSFKDSSYF